MITWVTWLINQCLKRRVQLSFSSCVQKSTKSVVLRQNAYSLQSLLTFYKRHSFMTLHRKSDGYKEKTLLTSTKNTSLYPKKWWGKIFNIFLQEFYLLHYICFHVIKCRTVWIKSMSTLFFRSIIRYSFQWAHHPRQENKIPSIYALLC